MHAMKAHGGCERTALLILNLGTRWKSGQPPAPAALLTRKEPPAPTEKEARWDPEPVWTFWRKKIFARAGSRDPDSLVCNLSL